MCLLPSLPRGAFHWGLGIVRHDIIPLVTHHVGCCDISRILVPRKSNFYMLPEAYIVILALIL